MKELYNNLTGIRRELIILKYQDILAGGDLIRLKENRVKKLIITTLFC